MHAAIDDIGFLPGEPKPSGAVLEMPEEGIKMSVDTVELSVQQEWPVAGDELFFSTCTKLASLVNKLFNPTRVARNGFAVRSVSSMGDADAALASSLKVGDSEHIELGRLLGMAPSSKHVDCSFTSGSRDLHVLLQPVTFERVALNRHTAGFKATERQKSRAERLNQGSRRFSEPIRYALMLDVDMIENTPPEGSLQAHFSALKAHIELLQKTFTAK